MLKPRALVKKPVVSVPPLPTHVSRTLFCPLFEQFKHTDVCTVLRAKRVCRVNCSQYFDFASDNEESIRAVLVRHRPMINHYIEEKKTVDELLRNVLPKGEHICEYCTKPFKFKKALKKHIKKIHRREVCFKKTSARS